MSSGTTEIPLPEKRRILDLLEAVLQGNASDDQFSTLERILADNDAARSLAVRFWHVNALIERFEVADSGPAKVAEAAKSPRNAPATVLTTLGGLVGFTRNSAAVATLLVAILVYGTFGLVIWQASHIRRHLNGEKGEQTALRDEVPTPNSKAVARLTNANDCRWEGPAKPPSIGSSLESGLLQLAAGTAELEFASGAHVTLEGPSEFTLLGANRGELHQGKLLASVPPPAYGFTIQTLTTTVVDLGTEFGVEADTEGATEVQVFKGKVELRPARKGLEASPALPPITLAAGTARRVEPTGPNGTVVVREVAPKARRLARSSSEVSLRQIPVEGAYASSLFPDARLDVGNLIRCRGLKGDCHSADWHDTMWHSNYGDIKNVIVSFDLARPHRIRSMKVWNFNDSPADGRFAWVGVKQADIYVSTSGKGDPLTQPANWKLVVTDQQFAPGTGTDDYATPTVVPLGDVEGRFVAMVIEDALGRDPRPANNGRDPDIVGLSEVQFFGSRVELPK